MLGQRLQYSSDHGHRQGSALELLAGVDTGVCKSIFRVKWQATASSKSGGVATDHWQTSQMRSRMQSPFLTDNSADTTV